MLLRLITSACCVLTISVGANAQFAPQAPLEGHEGIFRDDERIMEWATGAVFERGPLDITDESSGYPSYGTETSPLGYPDGDILSLGDGGHAVITFAHPIKNGPGADFAIFENGFANPLDATMAYLEFAFVEVSSDGTNFVRFPATCNIQDTAQTDNFSYSDASLVNNLAGKYIANYGTPFDLEELAGEPGLDLEHITHVRVIDVIGSLDPDYGSFDKNGQIINDPYPSVYVSGGFDLDAVAVLNSNTTSLPSDLAARIQLQVFPNPTSDILHISVVTNSVLDCRLSDLSGKEVKQLQLTSNDMLSLQELAAGIYILEVTAGQQKTFFKIVKK